jgi:hypothetical protein
MITFLRDGNTVIVRLKTGLYNSNMTEVDAKIACGNDMFAELLMRRLEEKFDHVTKEVREIEYKRGRKREKKQDWFMYGLGTDSYPKES